MPAAMLIITYVPSAAQREASGEERRAAAERIGAIDGLRWKYWLNSEDAATSGGVYLFESLDWAKAAGDSLEDSLLGAGARDIVLRFFEVDGEQSALTRGVIG